jgi:hypothetical protein
LFTIFFSWVCVRIDLVGAAFSAGLAAYLVYGGGIREASNIGFSLNMAGKSYLHHASWVCRSLTSAVGFSSMILIWVRILNEVEVNGETHPSLTPYVPNRSV